VSATNATDGLRTEEKGPGGLGHSFQSTILDGLKGLRIDCFDYFSACVLVFLISQDSIHSMVCGSV
jgi:hypothetical protein